MYSGLSDTCSCYKGLAQNLVLFYLAFALARLMALRRLVAGRALEFEGELCTMCSCIVAGFLSWLALDGDITFALQNAVHPFGICLGGPHGIAPVGCWSGTGLCRGIIHYVHLINMYL